MEESFTATDKERRGREKERENRVEGRSEEKRKVNNKIIAFNMTLEIT